MNLRYLVLGLALVSMLAGSAQAQKPRRNKNVITEEEITKNAAANAYDLIRSVRPAWLVTHGTINSSWEESDIVVYLDDMRQGYTDQLRNVPTDRIREIRFVPWAEAEVKHGRGHRYGAIDITTKR